MKRTARLLVVEDDPLLLCTAVVALRGAGYEVLEATSASQCLTMAVELRPDLVLLDVVLPDRSGLEVCRELKAQAGSSGTFVALMSSLRTTSGSQVEGLEAGADEYIVRPIEGRELVARVAALLRLHHAQSMLRQAREDLEMRVAERTSELSAANERLKAEMAERRQLEARLLRSQKLEAVGRLAAGLAHDFNNLLTVVSCNVSLMLEDTRLAGELRPRAADIARAAQRGADLTRRLLLFTRQQVIQPRPLDLNASVEHLGAMLRGTLGENIVLAFELAPGLPRISADPGMIEQIIVNLAVNARDAMPRGGQLTLRTEAVQLGAPEASRIPSAAPGTYVRLTMVDTGCGMDELTKDRIFEAFFTTKEVGKGTGLGLATVHGIVSQHKGWIDVESERGVGTTFKVHFPTVVEEPAVGAAEPADPGAVHRGSETVLVVEDQVAVRTVAKTILQHYGYRVLQAESGAAALDMWAAHREEVGLLLTDVVMPGGVDGWKLAARLRGDKPGLRVILMSGYGTEGVGPDFVLPSDYGFVSKPFDPAGLAKAVRECLDRGGAEVGWGDGGRRVAGGTGQA